MVDARPSDTLARAARGAVKRRHEHAFFTGMALAMALVVFIGFARSFFLVFLWQKPAPDASTHPLYYVHGAFAAAWIAFAVAQPVLIWGSRVRWHRWIGWAATVVAGLVVAIGTFALLLSAARAPDSPLPPTPLDFLGVIGSGLALFGVFVGLAVVYRRNPKAHKRLMYLATVNLLQAAVVRIPLSFLYSAGAWITFPVAYSFVLPLFIWDLTTLRRLHPVTLWGGVGLIASLPLRIWLSETSLWLALARWAVDWVR